MVAVLGYMTRIIAGVPVLNTPLINASIALARAELPDHGFNHVMRAWLNGQALINRLPTEVRSDIDVEAFSVAAILHDLGWSNNTAIISTDKPFEVDGANAARAFLQKEGGRAWDKHRIQLVWDAIALHALFDFNRHKEPEVAYTSAGTATELLGLEGAKQTWGDLITVSQAEWDKILAEFPQQLGLKGYIKDLMVGFCTTKPQVTYSTFVGDYGEKYVKGYTREGKRFIDILDKSLPG